MTKVSVIIPVYNVEKYIEECLDSLQAQTLDEYEIICVNDCSTDNSLQKIKQYLLKADNIRVIDNATNQGAAISRNIGLSHAKGKYVIFLDADDYFHKELLERAYYEIEKDSLDLVLFDAVRVDEHGEEIAKFTCVAREEERIKKEFCYSDVKKQLPLRDVTCVTWNKMIRRQFLLDNDIEFQNLSSNNDIYMGYITFLMAKRVGMLQDDTPLVYYRCGRERQITCNKKPKNYYLAILNLKKELVRRGKWEEYKKEVLELLCIYVLKSELSAAGEENKNAFWMHFRKEARADFEEDFWTISHFLNYMFEECCRHGAKSRIWNVELHLLYEMIDKEPQIDDFLEEMKNKKIVLWGLGKRGKVLYLKLLQAKANLSVCIDKNVDEIDKQFFLEVKTNSQIVQEDEVEVILASNNMIKDELKNNSAFEGMNIVSWEDLIHKNT